MDKYIHQPIQRCTQNKQSEKRAKLTCGVFKFTFNTETSHVEKLMTRKILV